jgi:hypothetical protein
MKDDIVTYIIVHVDRYGASAGMIGVSTKGEFAKLAAFLITIISFRMKLYPDRFSVIANTVARSGSRHQNIPIRIGLPDESCSLNLDVVGPVNIYRDPVIGEQGISHPKVVRVVKEQS